MRFLLIPARIIVYGLLIAVSIPWLWQITTGGLTLTVTSGSMKPTYQVGELVFFERATPKDKSFWEEGKIVLVAFDSQHMDNNLYVHRVHEVQDNGTAYLKGDGNPEQDASPVSLKQVVGTPLFKLSGTTAAIYEYTQSVWGRITIFGIGIFLAISIEMLSQRLKERRAKKYAAALREPASGEVALT